MRTDGPYEDIEVAELRFGSEIREHFADLARRLGTAAEEAGGPDVVKQGKDSAATGLD